MVVVAELFTVVPPFPGRPGPFLVVPPPPPGPPGGFLVVTPPPGPAPPVVVPAMVEATFGQVLVGALVTKTTDVVPPSLIIARTPPRATRNEIVGTFVDSSGDVVVVAER